MKRVFVALGAGIVTIPVFVALVASGAASAATVTSTPQGSWSPWKPCANKPTDNCATVRTITRTPNGTVFLGGDFSQLKSPDGTQTIARSDLAALDDAGNPVTGFAPHSFNGTIFNIVNDGPTIYVAGAFTKVDGKAVAHVARFDATTGAKLTYKANIVGTVYAGLLAFGKYYIGGKFTSVQGVARTNLAALDPATGTVDPTWAPAATLIPNDAAPNNPSHNNIPIRALAASTDLNRVYVAGDMDLLNGVARPAIAAVNPTTGVTDSTFTPGTAINKSFQGMSITVVDSATGLTPGLIFAAGGQSNKAWRLNTNGSIAWTVTTSGDVQASALMGSTVYLGGHFDCVGTTCFSTMVGSVSRIHIAAFDYNGNGTPDPNWAPNLGPTFDPYYYGVWVLQVYGQSLYVGGVFRYQNGTSVPNYKYLRFGPAVAGPTPTPTPTPTTTPTTTPPGSSLFADDFSSGTTSKWSGVGGGMTVSGGVATGTTAGKIAYLQGALSSAQPSVDYKFKVKISALDASKKVVIARLLNSSQGILNLSLTPTGAVALRNETTNVDWAQAPALSKNVWHTFDVKLSVAGTSGKVTVSVDGTQVSQLTGTGNFGTAPVSKIQIGDTAGQKAYTISWDDVSVTQQ